VPTADWFSAASQLEADVMIGASLTLVMLTVIS